MPLYYLPPDAEDTEPVYLYDDCAEHPIELSGNYVDQKGFARIRSMVVTPRELDRLCRVPLLDAVDNNNYAHMWAGGGMTTFQRILSLENVSNLMDWWSQPQTVSPNTPIVWLPSTIPPFTELPNESRSTLTLDPQTWCVQECPNCGSTSEQFDGHEAGLWFDNCRQCDAPPLRRGFLIDGQHRTRAMAQPDTTHHQEKIFCSMVSQHMPRAVTLDDAARIFIEINGGARPLERLHENFLASHFRILDYEDMQRRAAFAIAARLNRPAMRLWAEDTGRNARIGRITMLPGADVDFLPSWRIEEIVLQNLMGVEVAVPDLGGAGFNSYTPFEWGVNPDNQVDNTCNILRDYLIAIQNTWPGHRGPGTMPAWSTHRNQRGNLQQSGTMRVLLRLLPSVLARLQEQGLAPTIAHMENELVLLSNVSFNEDWATFIRGDVGVSRMERVLERILRTSDYGLGAPAWATLEDWAFAEHDPIEIINATASTDGVTFATRTTCAMDNDIHTRVSLVGAQSALVEITNLTTGETQTWDEFATKFRAAAVQIVNFEDLGMAPATAGQDIEITVKITTPMNNTRVHSPTVTTTVV